MPSLSELPGEIKRTKFIKALKRLGFIIDTSGGDGSHYKAIWPKNEKVIVIPAHLPKQTLRYVLKELEIICGLCWEDIRREL